MSGTRASFSANPSLGFKTRARTIAVTSGKSPSGASEVVIASVNLTPQPSAHEKAAAAAASYRAAARSLSNAARLPLSVSRRSASTSAGRAGGQQVKRRHTKRTASQHSSMPLSRSLQGAALPSRAQAGTGRAQGSVIIDMVPRGQHNSPTHELPSRPVALGAMPQQSCGGWGLPAACMHTGRRNQSRPPPVLPAGGAVTGRQVRGASAPQDGAADARKPRSLG